VQDVVTTGNYTAEGPHFLDWKALAEHGNVSMAAVPMYSCNKPVAVLCLASSEVSQDRRRLALSLRVVSTAMHGWCGDGSDFFCRNPGSDHAGKASHSPFSLQPKGAVPGQ
jgi:hypothetical protein